jgi:hypothetical protein
MSAPRPIATSPFCRKLRSKKWFFLAGPALTEADLLDASCDCWCGQTEQKVGPDGKIVDPEDCRRGRDCYESAG